MFLPFEVRFSEKPNPIKATGETFLHRSLMATQKRRNLVHRPSKPRLTTVKLKDANKRFRCTIFAWCHENIQSGFVNAHQSDGLGLTRQKNVGNCWTIPPAWWAGCNVQDTCRFFFQWIGIFETVWRVKHKVHWYASARFRWQPFFFYFYQK